MTPRPIAFAALVLAGCYGPTHGTTVLNFDGGGIAGSPSGTDGGTTDGGTDAGTDGGVGCAALPATPWTVNDPCVTRMTGAQAATLTQTGCNVSITWGPQCTGNVSGAADVFVGSCIGYECHAPSVPGVISCDAGTGAGQCLINVCNNQTVCGPP